MMGCDIYFMEERLEKFRRLCEIYINMKPVFQSIICDRPWCSGVEPADNRPIFIRERDTLSYGDTFGLNSTAPGEDEGNMFVEVIALGFKVNGKYYAFSPNGRIELGWDCARQWQYVDDYKAW